MTAVKLPRSLSYVGPEISFCWAYQEFVEFRSYDPKVG